jgi:hypothetical protein
MVNGHVTGRKRKRDGSFQGRANANANPILDTRTYKVKFPDGGQTEYSANVIAQSMWSQADTEGNQFLLLDSIIDHRKSDKALSKIGEDIARRQRKDRSSV